MKKLFISLFKITVRGIRINGLRPVISGGVNTVEFRLSNHYVFEGFDVTGGCYLHDQNGGNDIKSRAERNEIYYNWVSGGFFGEIELIGPDPEGNRDVSTDTAREDSDVVGNVFQHNAAQGTRMARVGGDGTGYTNGRYRFVNNTFILRQGQTSPAIEIFQGIESLEVHNNVFFRVGGEPIDKVVLETGVSWVSGRVSVGSNNWVTTNSAMIPVDWAGTLFGANPGFVNVTVSEARLAAALDLRLAAGSQLINAGNTGPMSPAGHPFIKPLSRPMSHPPMRRLPTVGTVSPRPLSGAIDIGAYEYSPRGRLIR